MNAPIYQAEEHSAFFRRALFPLGNRQGDGLDALDRLVSSALTPALIDVAWSQQLQLGQAPEVALRRFRNLLMMAIIERDVTGQAPLEEVLGAVTHWAEVAVQYALDVAAEELRDHGRQPLDSAGQPQDLLVVGMGKLGGGELNVSSDIDLIYVARDRGENPMVMERLAKRVNQLLSAVTADGFVFRVDTRLRPYGDSGPLICTLPALGSYFVEQGREWERFAWLKGRVIGRTRLAPAEATRADEQALMQRVLPFVFRRYLDFPAFTALNKLHGMIRLEAGKTETRRARSDNAGFDVKLGRGGIREIEFCAQLFQIVRGGRDASLRERSTPKALQRLAQRRLLEAEQVDALLPAWHLLRRVEHALQYQEDAQTHWLSDEPAQHAAIGTMLGMTTADFDRQLHTARESVSEVFDALLAPAKALASEMAERHDGTGPGTGFEARHPSDDDATTDPAFGTNARAGHCAVVDTRAERCRHGHDGREDTHGRNGSSGNTASTGYSGSTGSSGIRDVRGTAHGIDGSGQNPPPVSTSLPTEPTSVHPVPSGLGAGTAPAAVDAESQRRVLALRESHAYRRARESSQQQIEFLLNEALAQTGLPGSPCAPSVLIGRLCDFLESIAGRSVYLSLLAQHPDAFRHLLRMIGKTRWASDYLKSHPIVIDELLDGHLLEALDVTRWARDLREQLAATVLAGVTDADGQPAPDIERQMDVMREAHHGAVFKLLAQDLEQRLTVEHLSDQLSALADAVLEITLELVWRNMPRRHRPDPQFAVIAYGRLGGKELGYASDLDLVYLYDDPHEDAPRFYAQLAQRMAGWLQTRTAAGTLFEVDLRLRPNGNAGMLVSSRQAFEVYQQEAAWVWEHQALTRARHCAGTPSIGRFFETLRAGILAKARDQAPLAEEIRSMRRKMHDGHPNDSGLFDIKHDPGGMVDIEFMVQYLVLAFSHRFPELLDNKGNIELLRRASAAGLIRPEQGYVIGDAYRRYRQLQHELRLNDARRARVPHAQVASEAAAVRELWQQLLGTDGMKSA
ncbi:MAG: bifunctional [glutamate--ammonia ligase]-adenylyl-L-tyrosine phosphorylase/[glutamate--ammonia-ligase] adenylyltransferase [Lautropia sp.]|nr:bifunctional [glutamate--ammonia ligase]-adenylyl-L-tyrosine phosphorylase/[glutamate--ammonia-ligase] adenylyltransferase [Lautropia sp.]